MAVTSYSTLKAALTTFLGDTAQDANRDDFIDFAEAYFNRTLRCAQMEERTTLTLDSNGRATLPSNFLGVRSARYNGSPLVEMRPVSIGGANRLSPFNTSGEPMFFYTTSISNVHKFVAVPPQEDAEIFLTYFEKIPALDDTTTTNWLLDLAPDAYLYRALAEAYTWRQAADKAMAFMARADAALAEITSLDERARYGNAEIVLSGGVYP